MKKILPICLIGILLLSSFGVYAIDDKKTNNTERDFTHTVLGEFGTATWCGYCRYAHGALKEIYAEGEYQFYYMSLVCDVNSKAYSRAIGELGLTGYPTVYFDGGYRSTVGAGSVPSAKAAYISNINSCGGRTVKDVDINLNVAWLGGTEMEMDISVNNNEGSSYDGHLHVYITEIESSMGWYDTGGQLYTFAFLDYAWNEDIDISGGGTWEDSITWDGSSNGFSSITEDNIMVIAAVFSSNYVDDTVGVEPGGGAGAPSAPTQPDGESEGVVDIEYEFTSTSTDPNEDQIYYLFDWGDGTDSGWVGPYESGEEGSASHIWTEEGTYEIKAKAKDINGSESTWSSTHQIKIYGGARLDIKEINGGLFTVNSKIKNIGALDATGVSWSISFDGGAIIGKESSGDGLTIAAGEEQTIKSGFVFGFGSTKVTVNAEIPDGPSDMRKIGGNIYLFFIKMNPGG
jgi:hypothetical protein